MTVQVPLTLLNHVYQNIHYRSTFVSQQSKFGGGGGAGGEGEGVLVQVESMEEVPLLSAPPPPPTHTHTHMFYGPLLGGSRSSLAQRSKTKHEVSTHPMPYSLEDRQNIK